MLKKLPIAKIISTIKHKLSLKTMFYHGVIFFKSDGDKVPNNTK